MFHELLLASFGKIGSCSNFAACRRQFVNLFDGEDHPIASAPNFVCIPVNDVIGCFVPSLEHVDVAFVDNDV